MQYECLIYVSIMHMPCMTCNGYMYAASLHVIDIMVLYKSIAACFTVYKLYKYIIQWEGEILHVCIIHCQLPPKGNSLQVILTCLQPPQMSGNIKGRRINSGSGGQKQHRKEAWPQKDPMASIVPKDWRQKAEKSRTLKRGPAKNARSNKIHQRNLKYIRLIQNTSKYAMPPQTNFWSKCKVTIL